MALPNSLWAFPRESEGIAKGIVSGSHLWCICVVVGGINALIASSPSLLITAGWFAETPRSRSAFLLVAHLLSYPTRQRSVQRSDPAETIRASYHHKASSICHSHEWSNHRHPTNDSIIKDELGVVERREQRDQSGGTPRCPPHDRGEFCQGGTQGNFALQAPTKEGTKFPE